MMECQFCQIFFVLIFFATAVHGRCLGPYNDSYTCPRLSDPPERTHCCLWDGQPACCLPGGFPCSGSDANKRNYCPGPNDGNERTQCCVWNNQPACCLPGGSSCSNSADIRNYCPGPNEGNDRTHCCVWDSKPACCLPGGSSCSDNADIRNYCPGPNNGKDSRVCCVNDHGTREPYCCNHYAFWIIMGLSISSTVCLICCGLCCLVFRRLRHKSY